MATLTGVLLAILAVIASAFGAGKLGQRKGRQEQKEADRAAAVERERASLEAEKQEQRQSDEISKKIEKDVSGFGPGGAADWLRKNANRNDPGK